MRGSAHGSSFAGVFAPYAMNTSASRPATNASSSSKLVSSTTDGASRMQQSPQAELHVRDGDALVGGVDQPRRDLGSHGAGREEAVRDRAERVAHPVRVGEACDANRREHGAGLLGGDEGPGRIPQRAADL